MAILEFINEEEDVVPVTSETITTLLSDTTIPISVASLPLPADVSGALRSLDPFHYHTHVGESWSF